MKKLIFAVLVLMIISVAACQNQIAKQDTQKQSGTHQTSSAETTNDSASDSFGNDMGTANNDDKELSSSQLDSTDSGFNDIENM